jgi:hypothetical protein
MEQAQNKSLNVVRRDTYVLRYMLVYEKWLGLLSVSSYGLSIRGAPSEGGWADAVTCESYLGT